MDDCRKSPLSSAWSELPQKIISNIERCLDSALDMSSLGSVCKNWHSSRKPDNVSILSPFLPKIVSNVKLPFVDCQNEPVILVARAVFLVKPLHDLSASRGWLLTVEEMVPGKLRVLYPLSIDHVEHLPSNHPKYLDLSKFNVKQIAKTYGFKYASYGRDIPDVHRVVMCAASTVMVLYGKGIIIGMRLKNGFWSYVRHTLFSPVSDIISYGGNHACAYDCDGNVHIIDHELTKVIKTMTPVLVAHKCDLKFIFESDRKLFGVTFFPRRSCRGNGIVICRLNEVENIWIEVGKKTYCDKVLFISYHWRFFIYDSELDLSYSPSKSETNTPNVVQKDSINEDYVIYSEGYFNCSSVEHLGSRLYKGAYINLGISVVFSSKEDLNYWANSFYRTTTELFWPPPNWFWTDPHSLTREDEDLDMNCYNASVSRVNVFTRADTSSKHVSGTQITAVENSDTPTIQNLFTGVDTNKSNLVSTLQKIQEKYGDIAEEITIRNADIKARTLESLATAVIILQSNTGNSLNKDHADYLNSALCDLQQMKFKVDWLVPFVENAITVQKSKPLIDSMKDFDKAKAVAEEMKQKVSEEMAKLDQVEKDTTLIYERLSVLKSMDFNQSLGDGLC